ncbi:hypothetical protein GTA08_BOTSDO13087 [Neofusicoccum parvum]|uniref:Uncharacterized protein n=1 Tax=Neofusicoccum parvum TaxID=310453 RepID=A0ACB5SCP5_9PEZI|nr:hypothetical protein GTA08_BOTSDO13087 [Neofusicoccum parvum]GME64185.1 hypothetical protein GTA08_BOTSDO13087 [Neofusicoccum parvum]
METSNQNADRQATVDLPESVASSDTSFGSFVVPETQSDGTDGCAAAYPEQTTNFLPPDQGRCAAHMLNLEIIAHTHTEMALQAASIKASSLERHYAHQTVALAAWQASYQECLTSNQNQAQEIDRLKAEIETLKREKQELLEETLSWRDTFRPASA